ncbi:hypothetical protein C8R43DRAFT_1210924 [Mycena crocata]|nr:hypothetical protein C8R43DRAFT_1210924 [Mycena crocata]
MTDYPKSTDEFLLTASDIIVNFARTPAVPPPSKKSRQRTKAACRRAAAAERGEHSTGDAQPRSSTIVKKKGKEDAAPVATLDILFDAATTALALLPEQEYSSTVLVALQNAMVMEDIQTALLLGKAHTSYAIVEILCQRLPSRLLSRGSLTKLRTSLVHADALKIATKHFKKIPKLHPSLHRFSDSKIFSIAVATIADAATEIGVMEFIGEMLKDAIAYICQTGNDLPSLHKTTEPETEVIDETGKVIREMERRELYWTNPLRTLKPAAESSANATSTSMDTNLEEAGEKVFDISAKQMAIPAITIDPGDIVAVLSKKPEENTGKIPPSASEPETSVTAAQNPSAGATSTILGPNVAKEERRQVKEIIQNTILCTRVLEPQKYPKIAPALWVLMLSGPASRDPLETCGDAALQIAITVIVIDRTSGLEWSVRKQILEDVIPPLLSNATFWHIARSHQLFSGSKLSKLQANAWEIFAGALARGGSIADLVAWVVLTCDPIIEAAIDARLNHNLDTRKVDKVNRPKRKVSEILDIQPEDDVDIEQNKRRKGIPLQPIENKVLPVASTSKTTLESTPFKSVSFTFKPPTIPVPGGTSGLRSYEYGEGFANGSGDRVSLDFNPFVVLHLAGGGDEYFYE